MSAGTLLKTSANKYRKSVSTFHGSCEIHYFLLWVREEETKPGKPRPKIEIRSYCDLTVFLSSH